VSLSAPGKVLNHWSIFGLLTPVTLSPSAQPHSSRVFWVVITMQSGLDGLQNGNDLVLGE
jgi:hypothetical protein